MSAGLKSRRAGRVQAYVSSLTAADISPRASQPPRVVAPRAKKVGKGGALPHAVEPFSFSVATAAKLLGIGETLAWKLVRDGKLGSRRVEDVDRVLVTPEDCRAWLAGLKRYVPSPEGAEKSN